MNEEANYFQDTKIKIKQYIDQRILLLRLQTTKKVSNITAVMVTAIFVVLIALLLIIFASFCAGYWLSEITGSLAAGFGIVALFYLIVFLFVIFFLRKILRNFFINKFIEFFNKSN
ncbi:MAG: phage holin family protein [Parafilimonas sp.]